MGKKQRDGSTRLTRRTSSCKTRGCKHWNTSRYAPRKRPSPTQEETAEGGINRNSADLRTSLCEKHPQHFASITPSSQVHRVSLPKTLSNGQEGHSFAFRQSTNSLEVDNR